MVGAAEVGEAVEGERVGVKLSLGLVGVRVGDPVVGDTEANGFSASTCRLHTDTAYHIIGDF